MNNQNREIDKIIDEVFFKYSIYQIRLKSYKQSHVHPPDNINEMEYFIKQVDEIIQIFNKEEQDFLTSVYIQKKCKYDIPISVSNYYYRKRKYNDILYKCLYLT